MAMLRYTLIFALSALACLGQSRSEKHAQLASITVHFGGHPAGFWARYLVITSTTRMPGWIVSESGEEDSEITGIRAGVTSRFKGIFYAPGCALQAVEIPVNEAKNYGYVFVCNPVKQIEIRGVVVQPQGLMERGMTIDAKYVANWAPNFFGSDDGTDTEIPLGGVASLDGQNRFAISIPNLGQDRDGEIRIWLRDEVNGRTLDQLRVSPQSPKAKRTRLGGIPMTAFDLTPLVVDVCSSSSPSAHDKYGFAVRDDTDGCEP